MKTPGDWIGWGVLVMFIGAVAAGFVAAADTPSALPYIVAAPFGLVGGVMVQIGVIGWGVALGIRQTEQRQASPPQRVRGQTQPTQPPAQPPAQPTQPPTEPTQPPTQPIEPPTLPTQRPDPNLPPWDQPGGRSYR